MPEVSRTDGVVHRSARGFEGNRATEHRDHLPDYVAPLREALARAIDKGIISLDVHDLRDWTHDVHRSVDDSPYGGGPGMVMKPQVWGEALDEVCGTETDVENGPIRRPDACRCAVHPGDGTALEPGEPPGLRLRTLRGESTSVVDDAARRMRVEEVSIGDFVLIGGEVAVMAMVEATTRLIDGVLGNPVSHQDDSFSDGFARRPQPHAPGVVARTRRARGGCRAITPGSPHGGRAGIGGTRARRPDGCASTTPDTMGGLPRGRSRHMPTPWDTQCSEHEPLIRPRPPGSSTHAHARLDNRYNTLGFLDKRSSATTTCPTSPRRHR